MSFINSLGSGWGCALTLIFPMHPCQDGNLVLENKGRQIEGERLMEIQQLRGFVAVVEHKSFTKAAQATFRTQPTVSLQVKALEDELGYQLVDREPGRDVVITPEGEALYRLATRLLAEIDSIRDRIELKPAVTPGSALTVITDLTSVPNNLYEHIRAFKEKYPSVPLSVTSRDPSVFLDELRQGRAHLGFSLERDFPADIVNQPVYSFHRFLLAPKEHPLLKKDPLTLADIAEHPLIVTNGVGIGRDAIEQIFREAGLCMKVSLELDHPENVKYYVRHGMGVAILGELFIRPEDMTTLWFRDVSQWFGKGEIALVYPKNRILPPFAREFASMVTENSLESSLRDKHNNLLDSPPLRAVGGL